MLAWLALALLILSVLQRDTERLRGIGVIAAIVYLLAYPQDLVLVCTNLVLIAVHLYRLTQPVDHVV